MTEVFLCRGKRSPVGRHGGALARLRPDDMAAQVIDGLLGADDLPVDEVILGCANQAGEDNRNVARMAVLLSRLPVTVPGLTVNRLCASGLDAVIAGARAIATGAADLVIAGGVESMSRAPFVMPKAESAYDRRAEIHDTTIGWRFVNKRIAAEYGIDSMPETAENLAAERNVSREDQDAYALRSQSRYDAAWHAADILPVAVPGPKGTTTTVETDEHPRATSLEKLAALPAPFRKGGTVTAGNAAGVNDGACALLLASEAAVKRHGLTPLARLGAAASAGVPPRIMGIGPVAAVERLQARTGLAAGGYDVIELNEAFAAQVLSCTRAWGLADDDPRVNAQSGGIAIGHPLGMSGARIAWAAARRLQDTGGSTALATLCVGVGHGVALALHRV
ncbi:acetyl-CoA C-acyltransferase [Rhodobacter sp. SGA-6-6]|uniref:acetyl-CoA C-acyltransferase n=1 Tax=Rhodobacter sp. SGA-6-6 TaxID=2710882 RepID=UPI0013EB49CE|nr:acetyl-CoA C-acyltransferase [Rhodobacter sp. SGA-6-6]NGM45571.1 acetyl-CoA C-acyltransferase [Rhodobacter sp. SGA-6-6]